uniref:Uncharacterized protein n=1 Tax=Wuchereria bancrofti TaxID=6293 RepID=A0AAF5PHR4_WUCBA
MLFIIAVSDNNNISNSANYRDSSGSIKIGSSTDVLNAYRFENGTLIECEKCVNFAFQLSDRISGTNNKEQLMNEERNSLCICNGCLKMQTESRPAVEAVWVQEYKFDDSGRVARSKTGIGASAGDTVVCQYTLLPVDGYDTSCAPMQTMMDCFGERNYIGAVIVAVPTLTFSLLDGSQITHKAILSQKKFLRLTSTTGKYKV